MAAALAVTGATSCHEGNYNKTLLLNTYSNNNNNKK